MKKLVITLLIMTISICMAGCGNKKVDKETNNIISNTEDGNVENDDKDSDEEKPAIEIQVNNEEKDNVDDNKSNTVDEEVIIESTNNNEQVEEKPVNNQVIDDNKNNSEEGIRNCRLFFYNGAEDAIYYKDTVVTVIDKAVTKALTNGLKSSPGENFLPIPLNVEVLSAKLDGNSITVNLSSSYYDFSLGLGSAADIGMLESLALTYSYNYNVSNVRILVDGQNYKSGHLLYEDNEYINIENIEVKAL